MSEDSPISPRQAMAKQSSFARSFFSSEAAANPPVFDGNDDDDDDYRPDSRRASRPKSSSSSRRSKKPAVNTENLAMAAARDTTTHNKKPAAAAAASLKSDSTAEDSWYTGGNDHLLQDAPQGGDKTADESWNDDEVLEQYRLMAQHEATARVLENTGFDAREYERRRKLEQQPEPKKDGSSSLYGASRKPRQKLPEPRKIVTSSSDMSGIKPVEAPKPPPLKHTRLIEQKVERVPELCPGQAITGSASGQVFSADEIVVKCLGSCDKQLRVHRYATLVSCPVCHTVSPATAIRAGS